MGHGRGCARPPLKLSGRVDQRPVVATASLDAAETAYSLAMNGGLDHAFEVAGERFPAAAEAFDAVLAAEVAEVLREVARLTKAKLSLLVRTGRLAWPACRGMRKIGSQSTMIAYSVCLTGWTSSRQPTTLSSGSGSGVGIAVARGSLMWSIRSGPTAVAGPGIVGRRCGRSCTRVRCFQTGR